MEIPMPDIVKAYRMKLNDVIHSLTMQELHVLSLEKLLKEERDKNTKLQMELDMARIELSDENLAEEPNDW